MSSSHPRLKLAYSDWRSPLAAASANVSAAASARKSPRVVAKSSPSYVIH
jgi:hypothetical protein